MKNISPISRLDQNRLTDIFTRQLTDILTRLIQFYSECKGSDPDSYQWWPKGVNFIDWYSKLDSTETPWYIMLEEDVSYRFSAGNHFLKFAPLHDSGIHAARRVRLVTRKGGSDAH
ncbi:MAG: hypothetical protein WCP72_12090, partial [Desulfomonile sp.]